MKPCKCGSYAINHGHHGRVPEKHSDLCDVCYWRAEAAQARADALRWVLGQISGIHKSDHNVSGHYSANRCGEANRERARLRAIIEKELNQ